MAEKGVSAVTGRPIPQLKVPDTYAEDNNSPLHAACYRGLYNEVLMLLLRGHDIQARNVWKETPLHQCTSQGHLDTMLLLLDSGAEVNALDHQNLTPLHQAVIHGNKDAVELLLCYGANVYNADHVTDTLPVVALAESVHVCHDVVTKAIGRVWPLQHLCRTAVRICLGAKRRRRLKELPLPKHLISFLLSLPVAKSLQLHQNWERVRSKKSEAVRKRGEARRPRLRDQRSLGALQTKDQIL